MPYKHELANPLGYIELSTDEWIKERLKTYSFSSTSEEMVSILSLLKVKKAKDLPHPAKKLSTAFAIDGSVSTLEIPNIAAIKIGTVRKDLGLSEELKSSGPINPAVLRNPFKSEVALGLLPGKGVTSNKKKNNSWDEKLREELYQTLKHVKIPGTRQPTNLLQVMRRMITPLTEDQPLECPNCTRGRIDFPENIYEWECDECSKPVYYSDYMAKLFFKSSDKFTQSMILMERLLLQGAIMESSHGRIPSMDIKSTIFIADGALQYYTLPEISKLALDELQSSDDFPIVVSFLKSGHVDKLFNMDGIEDTLDPGAVGMITDELRKIISGDPRFSGVYGKSFAYRTLRGDKYFAFNAIPKVGQPHGVDSGYNDADEWSNYPDLATICEFIELNATDENGFDQASLDIIAEANHTASLPFHLSKGALEDIVINN